MNRNPDRNDLSREGKTPEAGKAAEQNPNERLEDWEERYFEGDKGNEGGDRGDAGPNR